MSRAEDLLAQKKKCPGCRVLPGENHLRTPREANNEEILCDVEICAVCGYQRLTCKCVKDDAYFAEEQRLGGPILWTGLWPCWKEAIELGFWCRWTITQAGHSWISCEPEEHGAKPDLGRLAREGRWDQEQRKWVLRQPTETKASDTDG